MDPRYDDKIAAQLLQDYIEMRSTAVGIVGPQQFTTMNPDDFVFAPFKNPKSWRVVQNGQDEGKEKVEAVFRLQGILCAHDLPPLPAERLKAREGKNNNIQHIHLRQSVTLTGLSCPGFEHAVYLVNGMAYAMDKASSGAMLPWKVGMWEGHSSITFHARYFTLRRDAPTEKGLEFGEGVDPQGLLKKLLGHNMVHTTDNKVKYSKRMEENGQIKYVTIEPKTFQAGDIVEISFDFYCAPVKGDKIVFAPHLCSLTLLDDTVRAKAQKKVNSHFIDQNAFTLKRLAWDMLDGERDDIPQFKKMTI